MALGEECLRILFFFFFFFFSRVRRVSPSSRNDTRVLLQLRLQSLIDRRAYTRPIGPYGFQLNRPLFLFYFLVNGIEEEMR